ncbi:hypothetical protein VDF70_11835 [Xanthomonas campestris pv. raphani]|uniref:hypothetical protein n=1 Tax=Xanthomonas campestris TaxID=339 RepID=UPI002B22873B|nr:hypothetical protein [Xanthomonas campestris]MEA9759742.1 hypothetical protein [Xanthomonas campestris pv. raphani]
MINEHCRCACGYADPDVGSGGDAPIDVTDPWRGLYRSEHLRANGDGDLYHPDMPSWPDDREDALDKLVHAQGFDFQVVAGDFSDEAIEDGDELYWQEMRAWNPEAPEGDWRLAWKGDTEDGPYAWFVRPMALRPVLEALAARQPVGVEPEYITDIHDVEQGLIRNPKYTAPAAVPVDALREPLLRLISAGEYLQNRILSTNGANCVDQFEAAIDAAKSALATHPQPAATVKSDGVAAIAQERTRQVVTEGMTAQGDAGYRRGQLAYAALAYLQLSAMELRDGGRAHIATASPPACWPWAASWWKPRDVRRDLVRAGALIAAQLDAIDQQAKPEVRNG